MKFTLSVNRQPYSNMTALAAGTTVTLLMTMLLSAPHGACAQDLAVPQKAQVCVSCHGAGGNAALPNIPNIAQQPKQFLVSALYQFREGKRKNDMMAPVTAGLSNADLNELAAYFSSQKLTPPKSTLTPEQLAVGVELTQKNNCIACHAKDLSGQQHIPRLAGQRQEYVKAQLTSFHNSTRFDMDGVMTSAAQALTDKDIEALAIYVAGLAPAATTATGPSGAAPVKPPVTAPAGK
jgi:cytochrome c553